MTDETLQDAIPQSPTMGDANPAMVAGTELNPEMAGAVHMVPPSPLGAIEKSKALVETRPKGKISLMTMVDVPVTLVMEVGRTEISVEQLMELVEGSIIDLRKVSVDSIEVRMNEKIIAQGEAIALQGRYGIRFTALERLARDDGEATDGI